MKIKLQSFKEKGFGIGKQDMIITDVNVAKMEDDCVVLGDYGKPDGKEVFFIFKAVFGTTEVSFITDMVGWQALWPRVPVGRSKDSYELMSMGKILDELTIKHREQLEQCLQKKSE